MHLKGIDGGLLKNMMSKLTGVVTYIVTIPTPEKSKTRLRAIPFERCHVLFASMIAYFDTVRVMLLFGGRLG